MWFENEFLQCGTNSSDGLVGKALDCRSRSWCKAWVPFQVEASAVKEVDLQDQG